MSLAGRTVVPVDHAGGPTRDVSARRAAQVVRSRVLLVSPTDAYVHATDIRETRARCVTFCILLSTLTWRDADQIRAATRLHAHLTSDSPLKGEVSGSFHRIMGPEQRQLERFARGKRVRDAHAGRSAWFFDGNRSDCSMGRSRGVGQGACDATGRSTILCT